MAVKINFNQASAQTHTSLVRNERAMMKSLLRLSTGTRILNAADDSAGLFIADMLSTVAKAYEQGNRNIQTGISALQIAEAASGQIFDKLQEIYVRAQNAANDVNDPNARQALQKEIKNFVDAIYNIGTDTEYNGIKLLDGTFTGRNIHYGARKDQLVNVGISDLRAQSLGAYIVTGAGSTATGTSVTTGGTLPNLLGANGSLASRTNFILAQNEYVKINDKTVYSNTSTTNYLVDAATLANGININQDLKNTGIEAKATNTSLAKTYNYGSITTAGSSTTSMTVTYNLQLNFYIGDGQKTFSVNWGSMTQTSDTDGSNMTFTRNIATLEALVARINSAAGSNAAPIRADNENGKLKLLTNNGETIATELQISANGTIHANSSATFTVDLGELLEDAGTASFTFTNTSTNTKYAAAVKVGHIDIAGNDSFKFEYSGVSDDGGSNNEGLNFEIASGANVAIKNLYSIDVTENGKAETALMIVSKALQKVDTVRSQIGATMNNLQSIFDSQKMAYDNTKEAESVIRNTDYAKEMSEFTTYQIRMQATVAMLAQSNTLPQLVLQLLR
jgi:flagellin